MDGPDVEILFQDEHCLVVNKPPGVLTQAPPGIDSLEVRVRAWLQRRSPETAKVYLGVPHRLDRPVSGAILFALNRRAAQRLSAQFEKRTVQKLYWACLQGRVEPAEGVWKDFVRKVPDQPRAEIAPMEHPEALYAVLHYRVLGYLDWGSWVEIRLDTGRYHQIRIQAASRGHPVLGDGQYGAHLPFGPPAADVREQPIALHARTLIFHHPKSKQSVFVRAPLPNCWKELQLPEILSSIADPPCDP
ncbi:MAG TPA: RluA family pseudouridine synthase [Thermoguttaceae bacterium]|nr:RluA family pseudouridine synthase [Thermoguttaceae bacterium]